MRNQNVTTEARRAQMRAYNKANMSKILAYQSQYKSEKMKNDPLARKDGTIRRLINWGLRNGGWSTKSKLNEIIGLPYSDYITYLENTWEPGMSWENYGRTEGCWNIDHIISTSTATTQEELISLFHFMNTRAMWATENIKKSNF